VGFLDYCHPQLGAALSGFDRGEAAGGAPADDEKIGLVDKMGHGRLQMLGVVEAAASVSWKVAVER
jgi:hypothetical protein